MTERTTEWRPGPAWLFCPADRPERYGKALSSADIVIVDLEDAVAPTAKQEARRALRDLAETGALDLERTVVRVNAVSTPEHGLDIAVTRELGVPRVMLAKADHVLEIESLPHETIVLLETPAGVERASELASADNVVAVMWGADDLVAGLGGTGSRHSDGRYRDVVRYARSRCLVAAKASGRLALDGVHMDIQDVDGLVSECEDAVAVGFDATAAIHPSQLEVIRSAYRPSPERVDWARRLLSQIEGGHGVSTFEGRMVDGPIFKQAERILRLAATTSEAP